MITKFKIYESNKNFNVEDVEVGDYVLVHPIFDGNDKEEREKYVMSNIGKVLDIEGSNSFYIVSFDYLPKIFSTDKYNDDNRITFYPQEIISSSKNKKELEIEIQANKFNL